MILKKSKKNTVQKMSDRYYIAQLFRELLNAASSTSKTSTTKTVFCS